jgi:hypothetical protein
MRLVFISDTHNLPLHQRGELVVPDGDVLVHCGDGTMSGDREEISKFAAWFRLFPHKHKVFVPGNHDWGFHIAYENWRDSGKLDALLTIDWAHMLIDKELVIDGVKFYGSPWQPEFCNWAFNLPRGPQLRAVWDKIPTDTVVLVTHTPPMGILDEVQSIKYVYDKQKGHMDKRRVNEHVGCADMLNAVRRIKPKVHAFGHIHGAYGRKEIDGTTFINASIADESYTMTHAPIVVELP